MSETKLSNIELAIQAEDQLKEAISAGNPNEFISGYEKYEKAILFFEGVGKTQDAQKLLERLHKILQVIIDQGDPEAPYFAKLGPFFILYAYHFKAKILEALNFDLSEAVKFRVGALDYAIGVEWVEQILNIMIDLLIEGYVDYCLRYLKFTKNKKNELINELSEQIAEYQEGKKFHRKQKNYTQMGEKIYNSFLHLLGVMIEKYNEGISFLDEGIAILRQLRKYADADFVYLESRLMALEANIRGLINDELDTSDQSHVKSRMLPHTLLDNPQLDELEQLIKKYLQKHNINLPASVGEIPILGANPAGSPHLAIVGQTGVGKTTLSKQIIRENKRVQGVTVFVFDHHLEYSDMADQIIQIGGEQKPEATSFYSVEEIDAIYTQSQDFIRNQQVTFSKAGTSPEDLANKMKTIEEQTRPGVIKFVIDTIESLLDKEENTILPVDSGETVVFWIFMDEPWISTTIVSTILKRILHMAIQEHIEEKTLIIAEEAQRLANDQWIKNLTSEGRKFGLFLIAISQVPDFDPWVVSNSELAVFRLRKKFNPTSDLAYLFTDNIQQIIPQLETGEYLSYHRDLRSWVFSFNPEALSPVHAERTLKDKIQKFKQLI